MLATATFFILQDRTLPFKKEYGWIQHPLHCSCKNSGLEICSSPGRYSAEMVTGVLPTLPIILGKIVDCFVRSACYNPSWLPPLSSVSPEEITNMTRAHRPWMRPYIYEALSRNEAWYILGRVGECVYRYRASHITYLLRTPTLV